MKIVVDSYAWIEIFLGSQKGKAAKSRIEEAEGVFTPDVVLAEIARKYFREGLGEVTLERRLATILGASEPAFVDETVAIESAKAYAELDSRSREAGLSRPSLFDAIVLAVARGREGKVLTGDQHFKGLPETIWIG